MEIVLGAVIGILVLIFGMLINQSGGTITIGKKEPKEKNIAPVALTVRLHAPQNQNILIFTYFEYSGKFNNPVTPGNPVGDSSINQTIGNVPVSGIQPIELQRNAVKAGTWVVDAEVGGSITVHNISSGTSNKIKVKPFRASSGNINLNPNRSYYADFALEEEDTPDQVYKLVFKGLN
ncbi:hypothetical protein [Microbulbifer sp.]|uniref:hypothetical protein n=1 Tax=Microbulbifer sp. TaxID=1908541 RepID=UPI003F317451